MPFPTQLSLALISALLIATTTASARDLCNRDDLTKHMNACLAISQPSDYQKGGLDDLLKGRFCKKGDLARDGMYRCRGDDAEAIKTILGCGVDAVMEIAGKVIADDDARKPASCN